MGYQGGLNLSQFAAGDPLTKTDPLGLVPIVCDCLKFIDESVGSEKIQVEADCPGLPSPSTCCQQACANATAAWDAGWRLKGVWGPNWTLDIGALCKRISRSTNPRCQCCKSTEECQETFRNLINAAQSLPVPWFQWETCEKWTTSFHVNIKNKISNPDNNCFKTAESVFWTWWNTYPHGHAAIKVVACDQTKFYLNHPRWWGRDCIFAPQQVPKGWFEEVTSDPWSTWNIGPEPSR